MKKQIFNMLLAMAIGQMATAQTLSVADVEVLPGTTASYSLTVNVGDGEYTGLQYEIAFPTMGFSTPETNKSTVNASWEGGSVNPSALTAGAGRVSILSMQKVKIPTGDFALGTVSFSVDSEVALGDYDVTISKIEFLTSSTRKSAPDVTFKVKVTDRLTLDENATTAPMAQSGVNVKVKRTIKAGEWNTICLPFTMKKADAESVFGSDAKIMTFTGYTAEINEETLIPSAIVLNFSDYTLNALKPLKAGTPYLIQTSKDIESFDLDGVDIVDATSDVTGLETNYELDGKFCGTLCKTKVPDKGLFISGNKFYYSTGNTDIKAYRGWFNLKAILNEVVSVDAPVYFSFDGETTGIGDVKRETITDDRYYNLSGQRVENPTKGLYIKNGKKVVVK